MRVRIIWVLDFAQLKDQSVDNMALLDGSLADVKLPCLAE